ncbi:MAG: SUMF1/EgtB/PvdO family nonheme iron enzyme [Rhodospirillales bacterium]|nr:SUMF1/EgtB/PvdO family nonheme iron enzyme [Rhodospirillales bacterium]
MRKPITLALVWQLIVTAVSAGLHPAAADGLVAPETIPIGAGAFIMGSTDSERELAYRLDEKAYGHDRTRQGKWYADEPRSRFVLAGYRITRNLITNGEYALFVQAEAHPPPDVSAVTWRGYKLVHPYSRTRRFAWNGPQPPPGREQHPVVLVSHGDALAYAKWLSLKTGASWRLPSEAQWEKAARGIDGRLFPWGQIFMADYLNSHDGGPFDTEVVGSYPWAASPFGMLDAAGQVFEWTATPAGKDRLVVKGGSWDDKGCGVCRPAARHGRPHDLKHILIGFRLVTDLD